METPSVSILLLSRNGAGTLPRVLAAVRSQVAPFPFEVVAVDSGSEDGTVELLRREADRLIEIRAEDFNHGTTRNVGMEACRAPLVVLLVQDADPASADWLARLVEPLLAGDPLAGTYARQVPRPDASPVVRAYLSRYPATGSAPRRQSIADRLEFDALTPGGRLAVCTFDNVCSCIRRDVWERHPFTAAPIAEDLAWAREVMLAGYDLAYVPGAVVVHSHDRPAGYELRARLPRAPATTALVRARGDSVRGASRSCHRRVGPRPRKVDTRRAWPHGRQADRVASSPGPRRGDAPGPVPRCQIGGFGARAAQGAGRVMRILFLAHGFPPEATGGTEL